jgi:hypothetical protein
MSHQEIWVPARKAQARVDLIHKYTREQGHCRCGARIHRFTNKACKPLEWSSSRQCQTTGSDRSCLSHHHGPAGISRAAPCRLCSTRPRKRRARSSGALKRPPFTRRAQAPLSRPTAWPRRCSSGGRQAELSALRRSDNTSLTSAGQ